MRLRDIIAIIGQQYDRTEDFQSTAQVTLRGAKGEFPQWLPAGYIAEGSGGKGAPAFVPWIAAFNVDETTTAQQGMYVVYLFSTVRKTVYLSLNQGVTEITSRYGRSEGRARLSGQAMAIRTAFEPVDIAGLDDAIDLSIKHDLPRDYELATFSHCRTTYITCHPRAFWLTIYTDSFDSMTLPCSSERMFAALKQTPSSLRSPRR